jgi:hypothetical protein
MDNVLAASKSARGGVVRCSGALAGIQLVGHPAFNAVEQGFCLRSAEALSQPSQTRNQSANCNVCNVPVATFVTSHRRLPAESATAVCHSVLAPNAVCVWTALPPHHGGPRHAVRIHLNQFVVF